MRKGAAAAGVRGVGPRDSYRAGRTPAGGWRGAGRRGRHIPLHWIALISELPPSLTYTEILFHLPLLAQHDLSPMQEGRYHRNHHSYSPRSYLSAK